MKRYLEVYKQCMYSAVQSAAAYRMNFIISSLITLVGNILFPLVTLLIYRAGTSFPGWSLYEVLLIQSVFTMSSGLSSVIFGGVLWTTMSHVREGSFEVVLLKPLNPLFFIVATTFSTDSIGLFLGGVSLFIFSAVHVGTIPALNWLQFAGLFAVGTAVLAGLSLMMAAMSFKWVGNSRISELADSVLHIGKYPLPIFPKAVQAVATMIIPVGMVGFLPASALLGRVHASDYAAVLPCFLFLAVGVWIYRHMIRLYEGVGG
ncbi:ABC transporter permease [Paenibacillus wynnii]|uniref:ABC transporter permease n=1 Tax=Paenibacillus wynnii TaxID=268407 RepID=UPI002791C5E2|nr:ABC-2 family transporter protein [Paenibacillus wynnii]MDQ0191762.1 ABC-2 type transport system permease protein [Paenibacillus wynnii]